MFVDEEHADDPVYHSLKALLCKASVSNSALQVLAKIILSKKDAPATALRFIAWVQKVLGHEVVSGARQTKITSCFERI